MCSAHTRARLSRLITVNVTWKSNAERIRVVLPTRWHSGAARRFYSKTLNDVCVRKMKRFEKGPVEKRPLPKRSHSSPIIRYRPKVSGPAGNG